MPSEILSHPARDMSWVRNVLVAFPNRLVKCKMVDG